MKILLTAIMLSLLSLAVFADIPRPDKPKNNSSAKTSSIETYLSIGLDRNVKEAKLIIPRSQLKQLRAELEALDDGDDHTASAGVPGAQTIVGGVFLSLAFVFAGFWFIRPGRSIANGGKAAAAAAIIFASGALATIAFGNAGPPAEARSITGKMFTQALHIYGFGGGKIKLEVSDEVKTPTLIVPNPRDEGKPAEE